MNSKIQTPTPTHRQVCYRCFRPQSACLCKHIKTFDPQIKFVILMHPKEAYREKAGTGRLAQLTLQGSQIFVDVDFTHHKEVNELIHNPLYIPLLMYPGDKAINISRGEFHFQEYQQTQKRLLVFLIDATWACAKKMMKLSRNLHSLQCICFTPSSRSQFKIKAQPHEFCLSTIEAIYYFLEEFEQQGFINYKKSHHALMLVFQQMVNFQIECAENPAHSGYRHKAYKTSEEKKPTRQRNKRSLFFS